ncbi:MAG: hypothetical protein FJ403_12415 [Verrucomicrobia bacterium]|nr:hypothetical protein [Verrucomicrobiota bacterium]
MKKMITSAGVVVLGAASVQAQYAPAPGLTRIETAKPWSVSASLRGFYDDNYVTRPSKGAVVLTPAGPVEQDRRDSFGFEVSPSAALNLVMPQTYLGLSYVYGMRWYEDRENNKADHSHQANLKINHAFTERYKLDVSDSFVVAQEPSIIDERGGITVPLRVDGDNIRNTASLTFTAGLTEKLGTVLGYSNTFYDYDQDASDVPFGSLSALLDRLEHLISANLRWQALPSTVGILGYQYGITEYDSGRDHLLAPGVPSEIRDSNSHYVFVGADHSFNPQLNGALRVGVQFTEYDNVNEDTVGPYVDGSVTWTYNPASYLQLGVRHTRLATDVPGLILLGGTVDPTLDQEATTLYGSVNHKITPKLTGSLLAQFQHGEFEGGGVDGDSENFLLAGLNLSYEINKFLAAEAGYNFDRLDSDIPFRSYTRNRVYVGIRATY